MKDRIVAAILEEIALRRTVPDVFLLDGAGRAVMWPARRAELPPALIPLVAMYFAQDATRRGVFSEILDAGGARLLVRIVPHGTAAGARYALTLEPFVVRSSAQPEPDELALAP
ncbi:MAG: hypothetical protein JO083_06470 [Candidatus Eremiobacteraeota bacterium]|nr:hypothetical protein [Candidatus Eremiobacteraeota bacterium]